MRERKFCGYLDPIIPIYRIANILALVPPYSNDGWKFKLNLYRCYAIFLSVVVACVHFAAFGMKMNTVYKEENEIVSLLDGLSVTTLTSSVAIAMIRSAVSVVANKFYKLRMLLNKAGMELNVKDTFLRTKKRYYGELVLAHMYILGLFTYEGYVWINLLGVQTYISYMWHYFGHYCNLVIVLLIYNYVTAIRCYFLTLNSNLKDITIEPDANYSNGSTNFTERLRAFRRIYRDLSCVVEAFNDVFGWSMLFLGGIIIFGVLELVNFVLVATLSKNFIMDVVLEFDFIGVVSMWCITLSIMGAVVVIVCDSSTKEAQRTASICYSVLLEIPTASNDVNHKLIREELILLTQQATHQCPYFTAAGFFIVDTKMMFGLLGTVTSYIIVLIQVNK